MATDITIYIERFSPQEGWKFMGCDDDVLGHFMHRNYILYGILANELSDYEMIDENTTRGVIPITPPRGVPDDADNTEGLAYQDISFDKDPYGRWNPSWVTLEEIINYPHWDKYFVQETGNGESYRTSYRQMCAQFLAHDLPKLQQLADNPQHIRLIYEFW